MLLPLTFFILFPSLKSFFILLYFIYLLGFKKVRKAMFFTQKYVYKSSVVQDYAQHILCLDEFAFPHICADIIYLNK
jgi:hypothetical protein